MSREAVRQLKRTLSQPPEPSLARESALALMERSIAFGHRRLAVIRLGKAVQLGAAVPAEHWCYCRRAAEKCQDKGVLELYRAAEMQAQQRQRETGTSASTAVAALPNFRHRRRKEPSLS